MSPTYDRQYTRQLLVLSRTFFFLRNEQAVLGILWYVLDPAILFLVLFFIFHNREATTIPFYATYLGIGLILYNLFSTVLVEAPSILQQHRHLLIGMRLSGAILVGSLILRALYAHVFELCGLLILFFINGVNPLYLVWYIPIIILFSVFLFFTAYSLSLLGVHIGDLEHIVRFVMLVLFISTPIFYSSTLPTLFLLLNPLTVFISLTRQALLGFPYPLLQYPFYLYTACLWTLCVGVFAYHVHRLLGKKILEYV